MHATSTARTTAAFVVLVLAAVPLPAQSTGTVAGRVRTAEGEPLGHARLAIRGTTLQAVAASDGRFRLAGVPAEKQTLDVRMLGYKPQELVLAVAPGETTHLDVVLTANPLPLDTVAVQSDVYVTPAMRGFEERRTRGPGAFFTREDIQRMQPRVLTDVFRRVPGVHVRPVRGGMGNNVSVQARGSECPMLFFMNGSAFPLPGDQPINHFVEVEEVIALEVYAGSSEIPAQFNSSRFNARCGVIVIWTRYGPEGPRRR